MADSYSRGRRSDGRRDDHRRGGSRDTGERRRHDDRRESRPYGDRDRDRRRGRDYDRRDRDDRRRDDRRDWDDDRRQSRNDRHSRDDRGDRNYRSRDDRYSRSERRYSDGDAGGRTQGSRNRRDRDGQRGDGHRQRRHSQRAGSGRNEGQRRSGPSRPNFREERTAKRMKEPSLPQDITSRDLDPSILQDLRSLSKDNAEQVGRHMVMAATLMQDDPQLALQHARAAKERAGRVAVVRETCGIAAYHAGEWKEALAELRAARRMSGGPGLMAVMADCERGLGHPEKAIEIARSEELSRLDAASMVELAIVVAGARQDMGQFDAAVAELERQDLNPSRHGVSASRLFYAYADALAAAGRTAEARQWFEHAADADEDELLDAADRLHELEG
ncbi:tetratricopeptide repeat protein [Corynebacterium durum]|uniref:tetratricopeptide repeat protein n=2 Tax=Corynebacterium durum TaxID=61592 RepID=UPI0003454406|nr:hypothetical protein [Corynebacterium durum]